MIGAGASQGTRTPDLLITNELLYAELKRPINQISVTMFWSIPQQPRGLIPADPAYSFFIPVKVIFPMDHINAIASSNDLLMGMY